MRTQKVMTIQDTNQTQKNDNAQKNHEIFSPLTIDLFVTGRTLLNFTKSKKLPGGKVNSPDIYNEHQIN